MKLNLNFLIYLDLSYQYRVNYTKRTTEIQHDRGMFLVIPLVMMMMMMILRMRVVTYFDKAHFYLVRCWFIIGLVPGCRSVLCMRDTRRTKRENVNKLPLFINDELLHTSDLLTRNIEPKSKIWRKSNCQPDQLFLRLLSFSLLINVPVWPIILCSMPCHPVYC